jgi:flagella basal body P-ring formation protein FlgA
MNPCFALILALGLSGSLSESDLQRLANERLPRAQGGDSLSWTVANPWPSLQVPAGATEVRVTVPPGEPRPGVVTCAVQVLSHGRVLRAANAALRCERVGTGLRVSRALRAGEILEDSDLLAVREALPGGERPVDDPARAVGMRLRRFLPARAWLTPEVLERPPVVKRNTPVEVLARMQAVSIRFQAQAQQEGGLGEVIRARGPGRGALLRVRVTGPGLAELVP